MKNVNRKIAIIGMACRVPEAINYAEFWELLSQGRIVTGAWPRSRQVLSKVWSRLVDGEEAIPSDYEALMSGGYLKNIAQFDNKLFGLSPKEARAIDPQQRILLEESWIALQDAGIEPRSLAGRNVGVLMGVCAPDYSLIGHEAGPHTGPYTVLGSAPCMASNRISYALDLNGPSITLDAACSASAHAIHQAINHLILGDCDLAIAGGANAILTPTVNAGFETAHMLSESMRCKSFDKLADGYVRSEGAGVVVLKLLDDAIDHNDPIHAVIEASLLNQDGRTKGIAMPSQDAQITLFEKTLKKAEIKAKDIDFVEAHGTGTPAGDPTEAAALAAIFRERDTDCYIGTLKANIGHTEAASGVLAIVKAVMSLKYRVVPRQVGSMEALDIFSEVTNNIALPNKSVRLASREEKHTVYGCISAFGFGGSNANIILSSYQLNRKLANEDSCSELVLSAHTRNALITVTETWRNYLPDTSLNDFELAKKFAHNSLIGEKYKISIPASDIETASRHLTEVLERLKQNINDELTEYRTTVVPKKRMSLYRHPCRHLPTFPFDRQELWANHLQMPKEYKGLLPENVLMDFGQTYINQHKIVDEIVVPGASMIIELIKSIKKHAADASCQIKNISFKNAFIIKDEASAKAKLKLVKATESTYQFDLQQRVTQIIVASGEIIVNK